MWLLVLQLEPPLMNQTLGLLRPRQTLGLLRPHQMLGLLRPRQTLGLLRPRRKQKMPPAFQRSHRS